MVATRLVPCYPVDSRGLKPTASLGSQFAENAKRSKGRLGSRCYKGRYPIQDLKEKADYHAPAQNLHHPN